MAESSVSSRLKEPLTDADKTFVGTTVRAPKGVKFWEGFTRPRHQLGDLGSTPSGARGSTRPDDLVASGAYTDSVSNPGI